MIRVRYLPSSVNRHSVRHPETVHSQTRRLPF
ncbi:hypothetical protein AZE42_06680 [Rhizopogon vesiculosus]|uniref:Uncharacterized protein n=1 Tax=Rhizopogon vesiculosus TaxID=180088 RepID=A0A1J8QFC2_9AGAM|nr:hypothetical protein AZE42_06680 [Rhizopogon vesiculosus]